MSIVGRKVKKVRLHTPAHFEGLGSLTATISETHKKTNDLEMTIVSPEGIIQVKSGNVEGLLYPANVIDAELKPEGK